MTEKQASKTDINRLVKKLTGKMIKDQEDFGLSPFCVTTPPPAVSLIPLTISTHFCIASTHFLSHYLFLNSAQLDADWWKATPDSEGAEEETAGADGDDGADEENQESSLEAPVATDKGPSDLDPPATATTSSGESSSDKDPGPTPPKKTKKRNRTAVAKVPHSRLLSTRAPLTKDNEPTQDAEADRKSVV